jgi:hypothetical protein
MRRSVLIFVACLMIGSLAQAQTASGPSSPAACSVPALFQGPGDAPAPGLPGLLTPAPVPKEQDCSIYHTGCQRTWCSCMNTCQACGSYMISYSCTSSPFCTCADPNCPI